MVVVLALAAMMHGQDRTKSTRPVVIELFTSEGCSSCPPADSLMLALERQQQLDGVPVIVIGEHVDYWDHGGWRDRFSSSAVSLRQNEYREKLHFDESYTPQAIIDGRYQVIASEEPSVRDAVHQAAAQPADVNVTVQRGAGGAYAVAVDNASRRKLRILLAVVESGLSSKVTGGENKGREVQHPAVLRRLSSVATTADASFHRSTNAKLEGDWNRKNVRVVVMAQDVATGAILGAATASTE